eukprot:RCo011207
MKKELSIIGLAMAPALGMAQTPMTGTTDVTVASCSLLQDNLKITLSQGVSGGYQCNTANNIFSLAACHTGGRVTTRTTNVQTPAGCGGTTTVNCTGSTTTTVSGSVVPLATTQGGSMTPKFPGSNCDAAGSTATSALSL